MCRAIDLNLKLKFESKIVSDEELQEVTSKVLDALVHEVDKGCGLAPDESDTYTVSIEVTEKYSGSSSKHSFIDEEE